jgi:hypothetical protein
MDVFEILNRKREKVCTLHIKITSMVDFQLEDPGYYVLE